MDSNEHWTTLPSTLRTVTVYREGAEVTRVAELTADEAGFPTRVRLVGLPLCLEAGSVRVRIEAPTAGIPAHALPLAHDVEVGLEPVGTDGAAAAAEEREILATRQQEHRLWDEVHQLREAVERLERLQPPVRPRGRPGEAPPPSPVEGRLALLAFRREQLEQREAELRRKEQEHSDCKQRLHVLEARAQLGSQQHAPRALELRRMAGVRLRPPREPGAATTAHLCVTYFVPGPRWAPAYALRFTPDFSRVALEVRGLVAQRTGEDWTGVQLTLSTAEALSWTELPELSSLRIGRRQPAPPRPGWREPPPGGELLFGDYDRACAALPPRPPVEEKPLPTPLVTTSASWGSDDWGQPPQPGVADEITGEHAALPYPSKPQAHPRPSPQDKTCALPLCDATELEPYRGPEPQARGGMFGLVSQAASVAAPKRYRPAEKEEAALYAGAAPGSLQPPEPVPPLAPGDLLRYGQLRLPALHEPGRGHLRIVEPTTLLRESLLGVRLAVQVDLVAIVREAEVRARSVEAQALPAGHAFPRFADAFAHAFRGEAPVELPADGAYHTVPLLSREAPAGLGYVTVPRLGPEVFRSGTFVNPLLAPLPAGPADIFVGGDYLLTGPLHPVAVGGRAEVGLGVEQGLKVARNTRFAEKTLGLLGGELSLEHELTIELRNNLARPADLEVRERIPVAREGERELTVEEGQVQPAWEAWEQPEQPLRGGRRWKLRLEPGQRTELRATYSVHLSTKKELVGGNRREG